MTQTYMMLVTYPHDKELYVMRTRTGPVIATEENKGLLVEMAERLMTENLISSYSMVQAVGDVICLDRSTGNHVNCGPMREAPSTSQR